MTEDELGPIALEELQAAKLRYVARTLPRGTPFKGRDENVTRAVKVFVQALAMELANAARVIDADEAWIMATFRAATGITPEHHATPEDLERTRQMLEL